MEFRAGLCESQEGVAAIAPEVASSTPTDLPLGDLAADVVLRAVGVQRDFRAVENHQQFGFVGEQPSEQAVEGGEAGRRHE